MLDFFFNLSLGNQLFILYILGINILNFFYFGIDKIKSQFKTRRVSEIVLWILSLAGGSIGAIFGMYFFRHKTKKLSFHAGMAFILMIQIVLIVLFLMNRP